VGTPMPGGGRHRRRIRIAVPLAAATLAAAVTGALMLSSANAAPALPTPTVKPVTASPSLATLKKRIAGAIEGDDIPGRTTRTSNFAAGTTTSRGSTNSIVDPKIIGGSTTAITSAPWMAQLWYYDDKGTTSESDDLGFFCGGAVVSPTKILTAAHCLKDETGKNYSWYLHGVVITGTFVF